MIIGSSRRDAAIRVEPLVALLVAATLVGASSCGDGGSDDELTIEPGACVSIVDDEVEPVECAGPEVDRVLVESLGLSAVAFGDSCPSGTVSMDLRTTFADGTRDIGSTWCVVSPENLTAAHQARIDEQRASQDDGESG